MFTTKICNFQMQLREPILSDMGRDIKVFENTDITIECDIDEITYDSCVTIPVINIWSSYERPNDKLIISEKSDIIKRLNKDNWYCDPVEEIFIPLILNNFRLSSDDIKNIINNEHTLEMIKEDHQYLKLLLQFIEDPEKLIQIISDSNFKYNTHYRNSWVKDYLLFVKDVNELEYNIKTLETEYLSGTKYVFDKATEKDLELLNYVKVPYRLYDEFILPAVIARIEDIDDDRITIKPGYSQSLIDISNITNEFYNTIFKHNFVDVLSDYDTGLEIIEALDILEKTLQDKSLIKMISKTINSNPNNKEIIQSHELIRYLF